jgi:hypothetical protein
MTAILFPDSVQRCLDSLPAHGSIVSWFESQTETMDTLRPQKSTAKQACDNCRRRKIKCDREYPCDKCRRLLLSCSYTDILQRKGPKLRHLYPLASVYSPSSTFPSVCETTSSSSSSQLGLDQVYGMYNEPVQRTNHNHPISIYPLSIYLSIYTKQTK